MEATLICCIMLLSNYLLRQRYVTITLLVQVLRFQITDVNNITLKYYIIDYMTYLLKQTDDRITIAEYD